MRTFTLALNLINAAELHHRLRSVRRSELEASLDIEEDGDNEFLSEKSIGPFPW